MLEGLYSAAAGMSAQQTRIDAVGEDLANVSTAGYKRQRLAFRDLVYVAEPNGATQGVRAGAGAGVEFFDRSRAQGAVQRTDQPLDVAIGGDGYLTVRREDGTTALTRSGALRLDANREVVTAAGERLVPPLRLPADVSLAQVGIAPDGRVTANGRALGRIALVEVPAPAGLRSIGDNLFATTAASGAARPARDAALQQGALEMSNVDMADAMTDLIDAQRTYGLASKAVQNQDQAMEIANGIRR
jgi:flagellar basal-body rod protein FlgG